MSRLLKLIAAVAVLAAGGAVAVAAASAPAQTRAHMIVCPLEPNDTITQPCCGPPIATAAASSAIVCCGTPQPINCPLGLTASSSPNPSTAGHKVTIAGRWPGGTAGQTVELWQELANAKQFSKVAQTKTGSLGDFQFVRKGVQINRKWYVTAGSLHSLTIAQQVKAVVRLNVSGGAVSPNHAGERVQVQRRVGSHWSVLSRPRLTSHSTYSINLHGLGNFRAVLRGDARNVRSVSPILGVHAAP
jgi:hypothetical protein